jgi:hypothetical protein
MNIEDRFKCFDEQLELISDDRIREFTKLCIATAPDYFFTDCPASSSGKYHPLDELSWDGTIIHTKRVFVVGYTLARGLDIEEKRDLILSACLIHDLLKQGEWHSGHTVKYHPRLAAELVDKIQNETQLLEQWEYDIIRSSVALHYGPWSVKNVKKPMSEYTLEELCVYMADYVASKKFIDVKYKGEVYE